MIWALSRSLKKLKHVVPDVHSPAQQDLLMRYVALVKQQHVQTMLQAMMGLLTVHAINYTETLQAEIHLLESLVKIVEQNLAANNDGHLSIQHHWLKKKEASSARVPATKAPSMTEWRRDELRSSLLNAADGPLLAGCTLMKTMGRSLLRGRVPHMSEQSLDPGSSWRALALPSCTSVYSRKLSYHFRMKEYHLRLPRQTRYRA
ncbi:hypothetical protein NDU88_003558 [Pleurodeles waltl]|uniref:Uncharacterized protein n=1 Tax=Pleurodeles waltl TaxID=8319 RepID=A0AAV7W6K3_PLEWA|nr:hypothetical protein NDU88_003558 [Pleurodeles waltl]